MSSKFLAFMAAVYIVVMIIGATMNNASDYGVTGQWSGANANQSIFTYLTNFSNATQQFSTFGGVSMPTPNTDYFNAMFQVITLRFPWMMDGGYMQMFYFIVFIPLVLMGVLFFVTFFIGMRRGNITFGNFILPIYIKPDIPEYSRLRKKWVWKNR